MSRLWIASQLDCAFQPREAACRFACGSVASAAAGEMIEKQDRAALCEPVLSPEDLFSAEAGVAKTSASNKTVMMK
jgi:hypothetical protein